MAARWILVAIVMFLTGAVTVAEPGTANLSEIELKAIRTATIV